MMDATEILYLLGVKTLILSAATLTALGILRLFAVRTPGIHRLVWGCVLLLGLFGAGFTINIPVKSDGQINELKAAEKTDSPLPPIVIHLAAKPIESQPQPLVEPIVAPHVDAVVAPPTIPDVIVSLPTYSRVNHLRMILLHQLPYVFFAWIFGILALLLRDTARYFWLLYRLRNARPIESRDAITWERLLKERNIRPQQLTLLVSSGIGPALIRLPFRSVIVVPENLWQEANDRVKSGMLRHELAHYLQRDLLFCFIVRLLAAVHWFNPLAWFAAGKFVEATEWSCDIAAFGSDEKSEMLFAESMVALHDAAPNITLHHSGFGGGKLTKRARLLKTNANQPRESAMKKTLVLLTVMILVTIGAIQLQFVMVAGKTLPPGKIIHIKPDLMTQSLGWQQELPLRRNNPLPMVADLLDKNSRFSRLVIQREITVEGGMELETVTLTSPLQITGKVVDDATGKPIPAFRVTEGIIWDRLDVLGKVDHRPSWQMQRTSDETNGEFTRNYTRPEFARILRVEADGYEPCESRSIESDEGTIELEFRMKPLSESELARQEKAKVSRIGQAVDPEGQ